MNNKKNQNINKEPNHKKQAKATKLTLALKKNIERRKKSEAGSIKKDD